MLMNIRRTMELNFTPALTPQNINAVIHRPFHSRFDIAFWRYYNRHAAVSHDISYFIWGSTSHCIMLEKWDVVVKFQKMAAKLLCMIDIFAAISLYGNFSLLLYRHSHALSATGHSECHQFIMQHDEVNFVLKLCHHDFSASYFEDDISYKAHRILSQQSGPRYLYAFTSLGWRYSRHLAFLPSKIAGTIANRQHMSRISSSAIFISIAYLKSLPFISIETADILLMISASAPDWQMPSTSSFSAWWSVPSHMYLPAF